MFINPKPLQGKLNKKATEILNAVISRGRIIG